MQIFSTRDAVVTTTWQKNQCFLPEGGGEEEENKENQMQVVNSGKSRC